MQPVTATLLLLGLAWVAFGSEHQRLFPMDPIGTVIVSVGLFAIALSLFFWRTI